MCEICKQNPSDDIHHLKYQNGADENNYIDTFHKNHVGNLINICKQCHQKLHKEGIVLEKKKTNQGYKLFYS